MKGQSVCQHAHGGSIGAESKEVTDFIVLIARKK